MLSTANRLATAGFDALALKPAERALDAVPTRVLDRIVVDYEGHSHLPSPEAIATAAESAEVVLTAPVRVDGFDPLGDDQLFECYRDNARFALVAGNGAYLDDEAANRAIAPRIATALKRYPDAWVGTEGIERLAMATGATQYELLSPQTPSVLQGLRAAGFDGRIAVYAPTVVTADRTEALASLEAYLRRRGSVRRALDNGHDGHHARERHVLLQAMDDYAIVGDAETIEQRLDTLREAGATTIVGYPADME